MIRGPSEEVFREKVVWLYLCSCKFPIEGSWMEKFIHDQVAKITPSVNVSEPLSTVAPVLGQCAHV